MPELTPLTLATIQQVDLGRVGTAFDLLLKKAITDCIDRPADKRTRKVTLQINLLPVAQIHDKEITCEGAKGTVHAKLTVPDYETQTLDFGVKKGGHAYFADDSPGNHKQAMMFDGDDDQAVG